MAPALRSPSQSHTNPLTIRHLLHFPAKLHSAVSQSVSLPVSLSLKDNLQDGVIRGDGEDDTGALHLHDDTEESLLAPGRVSPLGSFLLPGSVRLTSLERL